MCGDKKQCNEQSERKQGSPPHVRGQVLKSSYCDELTGITPACAGTSVDRKCQYSLHRDHPRMCGDKFAAVSLEIYILGSPPHVRGQD